MEVVRANSYLRQVLDLDSSRFPTGNGNERNIWAKNAPSQLLFASVGALYVIIHPLLLFHSAQCCITVRVSNPNAGSGSRIGIKQSEV